MGFFIAGQDDWVFSTASAGRDGLLSPVSRADSKSRTLFRFDRAHRAADLDRRCVWGSHSRLAARAIPIQAMESRPGLSRWTLALLTPSELLLRMVALVGLCRDGDGRAWMAPDLDRTGWDGVGSAESDRHSLGGATGPREPGRGLSRLSTDDERVLPVASEITVIR